jgi:hypothetical protein
MSFLVPHRYGSMDRDPPLSSLPALLQELDDRPEDEEHASVAVSHEAGWCLEAYRGGYLTFENAETGAPRRMLGVPSIKIIISGRTSLEAIWPRLRWSRGSRDTVDPVRGRDLGPPPNKRMQPTGPVGAELRSGPDPSHQPHRSGEHPGRFGGWNALGHFRERALVRGHRVTVYMLPASAWRTA